MLRAARVCGVPDSLHAPREQVNASVVIVSLGDSNITDWAPLHGAVAHRIQHNLPPLQVRGMPASANAALWVKKLQTHAEPLLDGFAFLSDFFQFVSFPFTLAVPWTAGTGSSPVYARYFDFLRGWQLALPGGFEARFWAAVAVVALFLLAFAPAAQGPPRRALAQVATADTKSGLFLFVICKLVATSLFLPVFRTLVSALDCTRSGGAAAATLDAQRSIMCWTGGHWAMVGVAPPLLGALCYFVFKEALTY